MQSSEKLQGFPKMIFMVFTLPRLRMSSTSLWTDNPNDVAQQQLLQVTF
jgi:hypothetical protein